MSTFEKRYKQTPLFKALAKHPLRAEVLLLKSVDDGSYLDPVTLLAHEMYEAGRQSVKAPDVDTPALAVPLLATEPCSPPKADGEWVQMRPPFYFSQLRKGMVVTFKGSGHTSFIRDLVKPDNKGQAFFGIIFEKTFDSSRHILSDYAYAFGSRELLDGKCHNDSGLDIDYISLHKEDMSSTLPLSLTWYPNVSDNAPHMKTDSDAWLHFGLTQSPLGVTLENYSCSIQFADGLKREDFTIQASTPKVLIEKLRKCLPVFLGLRQVHLSCDEVLIRGEHQNYLSILQYRIPKLFKGQDLTPAEGLCN